jgi:Motility quorum-sensing regulator, toxin of MqsA
MTTSTRPQPHYSIDEVKQLVAAGAFTVMKGRGLALLVPPLTYREAMGFVAAAIQMLTADNFCETVDLARDTADVYGLTIQSTGWYIKLCIDRDGPYVAVISFHPPMYPMTTPAGVVNPP